MELNKSQWVIQDKFDFLEYLNGFKRSDKVKWSKNILKTDSDVLGMRTNDVRNIAEEIMKGNFYSFLDLDIVDYYETIAIYGMIISRLSDKKQYLKYIDKYLAYMNCWAHCDLLQFPLLYEEDNIYLELSKQYLNDPRTMVRRLSLFILFQYVKNKKYLERIFSAILELKNEDEYYVIMMAGWLLSECVILHENETIHFISSSSLNKKIVNKSIQKCRESNRLEKEKKDYLLQFKVK